MNLDQLILHVSFDDFQLPCLINTYKKEAKASD